MTRNVVKQMYKTPIVTIAHTIDLNTGKNCVHSEYNLFNMNQPHHSDATFK